MKWYYWLIGALAVVGVIYYYFNGQITMAVSSWFGGGTSNGP